MEHYQPMTMTRFNQLDKEAQIVYVRFLLVLPTEMLTEVQKHILKHNSHFVISNVFDYEDWSE